VQRAHLAPGFLVAGAHFSAYGIVSGRDFLPNGRKSTAHLVSELQNLRLECRHASGEKFKTRICHERGGGTVAS
jgi:hypothetical protein